MKKTKRVILSLSIVVMMILSVMSSGIALYISIADEVSNNEQQGDLICGLDDSEGHIHDAGCYSDEVNEEVCPQEDIEAEPQVVAYSLSGVSTARAINDTEPVNDTEQGNNVSDAVDKYVAKIGDIGYETLEDALKAVKNSESKIIVLQKDIKGTFKSTGTNYTLDMNGHTIDGAGNGIVYTIGGGIVIIKNGTITGGVSDSYGGGLYIYGNCKLTTESVTVKDNKGKYGGGVFIYNGAEFTANNTVISNNTSADNNWYGGGGIFLWGGTVKFTGGSISNNISNNNGGGIYVYDRSTDSIELNNCTVSNNKTGSSKNGGGIYMSKNYTDSKGSLVINSCKIIGNNANYGGGIYVSGLDKFSIDKNITADDDVSAITGNNASWGGGIYVQSSNASIGNAEQKVVVADNTGSSYGGGIYVATGETTLSNIKFTENKSKNGAALTVSGGNKTTVKECTFSSNHGVDGYRANPSVIYLAGYSTVKVFENCKIMGNNDNFAYIAYVVAGQTEFNNCEIKNNKAGLAGAIYTGGNLTLNNTVITGNEAVGGAADSTGGIYVGSGTANMKSGAVYSNETTGANEANDWYIAKNASDIGLINANEMVDSKADFTDYVWSDINGGFSVYKNSGSLVSGRTGPLCLTAVQGIVAFDVAAIGDTNYTDLRDAVGDADNGTEIKLLRSLTIDYKVDVDKAVKVNLNNYAIKSQKRDKVIFDIDENGSLELYGSGDLKGKIVNNGILNLNMQTEDDLKVILGNNKTINIGDKFNCTELSITLDDAVLSNLNNVTAVDDFSNIPVITGNVNEELIDKINIEGLENPLIVLKIENNKIVLHKQEVPAGIYLGGINGDDSNSGTSPDESVATFSKAKSILKAGDKKVIYITSTITIDFDEEVIWKLDNDNYKIMRYPGFKGNLIEVKSPLQLQNIIIDGASGYGYTDSSSLITVEPGGELTLEKGAVLQNNNSEEGQPGRGSLSFGGGIYNEGILVVSDGMIQNCTATYGGGVYSSGTMMMKGGKIANNKACNTSAGKGNGGGICVVNNKSFMMSGGDVVNNTSENNGGGISVGTSNSTLMNANFEMNGGTVGSNVAKNTGGGIYVSCNSESVINAGNITGNSALAVGSSLYSGGGIYVNGGRTGYESGFCQLYNAVITDNTAGSGNDYPYSGGGLACCPTSEVAIYVSQGAAIYGNNSKAAEDIYAYSGTMGGFSGTANIRISEYMLGGYLNNWKYGAGSSKEGELVPINRLYGVNAANLKNGNSARSNAVKAANELATVYITGNESVTNGGGIGTNGKVIIGTEPTETVNINVNKIWDDTDHETVRPESVKVKLFRNGVQIGFIEVNESNEWKSVVEGLPKYDDDGNVYKYEIKEVTGIWSKYDSTISDNGDNSFTIINKYNPKTPSVTPEWATVKIQAQKTVDGDKPLGGEYRFVLKDNNGNIVQTVNNNEGAVTFDTLTFYKAGIYTYTISELKGNNPDMVYDTSEYKVIINVTGEGISYKASVTYEKDGKAYVLPVFNNLTEQKEDTISVYVNKLWKGDAETKVKVQLYKDGKQFGEPVVLDDSNNWEYTWTQLNKDAVWTVNETDIPEGYMKKITHIGNNWTIVNEQKSYDGNNNSNKGNNDKENTIKTGDLTNMGIAGIVFTASLLAIAVIITLSRRKKQH